MENLTLINSYRTIDGDIKSLYIDEEANEIITSLVKNKLYISIRPKKDKKVRKIGFVNLPIRTLVITRNEKKHVHIHTNSYGINYNIIKYGRTFDNVLLIEGKTKYTIPREWILENGKIMIYDDAGFERQIFINIVDIDKFANKSKFA